MNPSNATVQLAANQSIAILTEIESGSIINCDSTNVKSHAQCQSQLQFDLTESNLNPEEQGRFTKFVQENTDATSLADIGQTDSHTHVVDTGYLNRCTRSKNAR